MEPKSYQITNNVAGHVFPDYCILYYFVQTLFLFIHDHFSFEEDPLVYLKLITNVSQCKKFKGAQSVTAS